MIGPDVPEIASALVRPNLKLYEALRRLDDFGRKVVFVTNEQHVLLGVITDGDVRRWILSGHGLDRPVSEVMNREPVVLRDGFDPAEARSLLARHGVDSIPVVDAEDRVVSAVWWVDYLDQAGPRPHPVGIPLVVMAGGVGSRLAPYTRVLPKPLLPIGDVPIIERILERFIERGCSSVFITVNHMASLIRAYFADAPRSYDVTFVDEPEPRGTAGGLALLGDRIDTTFFVSNCDILVDADYGDILRYHRASGNRITLVGSLKRFTIPYGVCETTVGGKLLGISEKPTYDHLVSTGMYVMEPDVLADIPADRPCDVTDLIEAYLEAGTAVGVYPISERSWLDMGQFEELSEMRNRLVNDR